MAGVFVCAGAALPLLAIDPLLLILINVPAAGLRFDCRDRRL
jgi:hypothetical protein